MMQWQKLLFPVGGAVMVTFAYNAYGWRGVALAVTLLVMWLVWQFSRMMVVLRRAAAHPVGQVASVAALQRDLKAGQTLLQVVGMARAMGKQESAKGVQPEVYTWVDDTLTQLRGTFVDGKLARWKAEPYSGPVVEAPPAADANP